MYNMVTDCLHDRRILLRYLERLSSTKHTLLLVFPLRSRLDLEYILRIVNYLVSF